MKIALIGYGKMGKEIEKEALSMKHTVVLKINKKNSSSFTADNLRKADVAIEFTQPSAAFSNIRICFESGIPVVVGTTGWYEHLDEIKEQCKMKNGSMLYASNFSIGVNLFFELNRKLIEMMRTHNEYKISMEEIHHVQKKDKPSGTAITLANDIIAKSGTKKNWSINNSDEFKEEKLFINAVRKDNMVGIHKVKYESEIDKIEIKHEAFSRKGFAQGAILAAQWLIGKKGFYEMKDFMREI